MESDELKIRRSFTYELEYFSYFKDLLVNENMKRSTFNKMIQIEKEEPPQFFHIKAEPTYQSKLAEKLDTFILQLKKMNIRASIVECLHEKYGIFAQIFCPKLLSQNNTEIQDYLAWINQNTKEGFISRFPLSSFIPYIFLDIQKSDRLLSCGINHPQILEILLNIDKNGYIFINEPDIKLSKVYHGNEYPNYCVISYPITKIPNIEKFDKVLCIAPSTEDGTIFNKNNKGDEFSLNAAIENHQEQKQYLINSLEKLKIGGICVYSTTSINTIENESVINSVLKMPQYKNKFELVDCSSMFKEIKRKKGLKNWKLNEIQKERLDNGLLESISSNSIIENLDRCMRFYPHQIYNTGVFVAVIKKLDEIERSVLNSPKKLVKMKKDKNDNNFSIVSSEMIQTIENVFGLPNEFENISFILYKNRNIKKIYRLNRNLMETLNNFGLDSLKLSHAGSLAFTIIDKEEVAPFVPSVQNLCEIAKRPTKRFINIKLDDIKTLIENDKISSINSIKSGGVYLILEAFGPLIGGFIENEGIKVFESKDELNKIFKIAENAISNNYIVRINSEHEQRLNLLESQLNNKQNSNEMIQFFSNEFKKFSEIQTNNLKLLTDLIKKEDLKIDFLTEQITSIKRTIGLPNSVDNNDSKSGILFKLKEKETNKFDRLFIASQSSNDYYNMIDPNCRSPVNLGNEANNFIEFELENEIEICGVVICSSNRYFPKSFNILIDNKIVRMVEEADKLNGKNKEMTILFDSTRGKIVRFSQTGPNWDKNNKNLKISHFELLSNEERFSNGVFSTLINENENHDPHKIPVFISAKKFHLNSFYLSKNTSEISTFSKENSWFQIELNQVSAILTGFRIKRSISSKLKNYKIICTYDNSLPLEDWFTLIEINEKNENENNDLDIYKFEKASPPVKFIRLVLTGPNWDDKYFMQFFYFDLFGEYI